MKVEHQYGQLPGSSCRDEIVLSFERKVRCQTIALRANGEEGKGLGRFWQSRFKAVRILDEESLLACAAYVDLNPIRAALAETLAMADAEYLTILDWLARDTVAGKRGQTPAEAPPVLERLGIDAVEWSKMVKDFGRTFKNVAGKPISIEQARSLKSRRKFYVSRI